MVFELSALSILLLTCLTNTSQLWHNSQLCFNNQESTKGPSHNHPFNKSCILFSFFVICSKRIESTLEKMVQILIPCHCYYPILSLLLICFSSTWRCFSLGELNTNNTFSVSNFRYPETWLRPFDSRYIRGMSSNLLLFFNNLFNKCVLWLFLVISTVTCTSSSFSCCIISSLNNYRGFY